MARDTEDAELNDSDGRETAAPGTPDPARAGEAAARESRVENGRRAIERTWEQASKLAETLLDPIVGPTSAFAATAVAWLTTVTFFVLSLVIVAGLAAGGLFLFLSLELLALLAYAYPGMLFLLSVAAGIVPAVLVYWAVHALFGIEAHWTTWGPFALITVGAWGSYYYWRFGRVISATGASTLAVYRGAAPKAKEIFGAPFVVLSGIWDVVTTVLGVFRGIAGEFFALLRGRLGSVATRSESAEHAGARSARPDKGDARKESSDPREPPPE